MADNLRKYTTQEVLNKVYSDASGGTIGLNAATSKETLNAVLDSSAANLNVSLSGGTITGDLTIDGELTVSGTGAFAYTEVITGDMAITNTAATVGLTINQSGDNYALSINQDDTDKAAIYIDAETTTSHVIYIDGPATTDASTIRLDGLGGLTTGAMFNANITSANLETGASTGAFRIKHSANSGSKVSNIMHLHNDDASSTGTTVLKLQQDSTAPALVAMGNVGIGTAAPAQVLSVNATGDTYIGLEKATVAKYLIGIEDGGATFIVYNQNTSKYSFKLDANSRISLSNNAGHASNTVFGKLAGVNLAADGAQNCLFGDNAGNDITTGDNNVMIGYLAGDGFDAESKNIGIGTGAFGGAVVGADNCIAIGSDSLAGAATQDGTIAIGDSALTALTLGARNIALGYRAMSSLTEGIDNIAIGYDALLNCADTSANYNIAIGSYALEELNSAGANNIAIGVRALETANHADIDGNIAIGYECMDGVGANGVYRCVGVGESALGAVNNAAAHGSVAVGYQALTSLTSGASNTAVGYQALATENDGEANTAVGYQAFTALNTASGYGAGVAIGKVAGAALTTGINNTIVGAYALDAATTALNNVAIGTEAMSAVPSGQAVDGCVSIGYQALLGAGGTTTGVNNSIAIGSQALKALTSGASNVAVGYQSMDATTTGGGNTALGYESLSGDTDGDGGDNTALGHKVLTAAVSPAKNVAIGDSAMRYMNGTANGISRCVAIGANAFAGDASNTTGGTIGAGYPDGTVAIGYDALNDLTTGAGNVAIGYLAATSMDEGEYNTVVGYEAYTNATPTDTNGGNTIMGYQAGKFISTGYSSTFIGSLAGIGDSGNPLAGNSNTAIGKSSGALLQGAADGNTLLGAGSASTLTTGLQNVVIGSSAVTSAATSSQEIVIGQDITGNGNYSSTVGRHLVSKSRRMTLTKAHTGVNSVIAEVFKIPALSIIKSVSCVVVTKSSDVNPYTLNLTLSTSTGTSADTTVINAGTITVPEILGAGASATYSQNSATVMGTAADIVAGSGGVDKTTYLNRPNTTIVGTADTYLYVCNAVDNGTGDTAAVVLDIVVEYVGLD